MKPRILTITFGLLAGMALPVVAQQQVCMPAAEMEAALIDWYGERPVGAESEDRRQLWASERTGTWTIVKRFSDGGACVLAQGEDWGDGARDAPRVAQLLP